MAVNGGLGLDLAKALALETEQFAADPQLVTRHHRAAETNPINPGKDEQALGQIGHLSDDQSAHLGHRLDDQHPRHQGTTGEMPLEVGFIDGDVLDRDGPFARLMFDHPIHKGERITMGQQSLYLLRGEQHRSGRAGARRLGWTGL